MYDLGAIGIILTLEDEEFRDGLQGNIEATKQAAEELSNEEFEASLTLQIEDLQEKLEVARQAAEELSNEEFEASLTLQIEDLQEKLEVARQAAEELSNEEFEASLTLELQDLYEKLEDAKQAAEELSNEEVKVPLTVDGQQLHEDLDAAKQAAEELSNEEVKVPLDLKDSNFKKDLRQTRRTAEDVAEKPITTPLKLNDTDFKQKLEQSRLAAEGISGGLIKTMNTMLGMAAGIFAFAKVKDMVGDAVSMYSEAFEAAQKFDVVFSSLTGSGPAGEIGKATAAVKELRENFDMSEIAVKSTLSATGDLLTGFGFTQEKAMDLSLTAAKLGADLASFTNYAGGAEGATTALTKGMLGQTEMLKQLGIVVHTNDEEFTALVKSIMKTEGVTLREAKAQAVLNTALKQSPNALNDYERNRYSLSNQMKATGEILKDLKLRVGEFIAGAAGLEKLNGRVNEVLKKVTDTIEKNVLEWIYYTRTAANAILTGFSGAWQVVAPIFTAGSEVVGKGLKNIWEVGKWTFESLGTIFKNFGDIIAAVWKDSVENTKAFFNLILESAATVGSSLWGLITGKMSFDDIKKEFVNLADSAIDLIANQTKHTDRALAKAGVEEIPDFEFPDFGKVIDGFVNMTDNIEKENLKGVQRQLKIDEEYMRAKLGLDQEEIKNKSAANKAKEEIEKGKDTAGSFSAAIVEAMLGRMKPEEETAKNTNAMRRSLQRLEKKPVLTF
ncbi:MAG: hypothetical protein ACOYI9_13565 [Candidatus Hydrogenedentales bacterium]|jgi:plasmid maintenance system antidote protein VapI